MIGHRMRHARVAAAMTLDEVVEGLAERGVPLTKAGLSKYELGGSTPKARVLRALGRVLGVPATYFLEEPSVTVTWLTFRKGARLGKNRQARIRARAESRLEVYMALRRALEPSGEEQLASRTRVRDAADAERAAEALRERWRLGDQPLASVTRAIEDGGGVVLEAGDDDGLFDGLSGWVDDSVPVVVVSPGVSDDRRRFSLAHELGHLVMAVGEIEPREEEKLAHRFAAAFLVPEDSARRELGRRRRRLQLRELAALKRKYGLSMQAWIFRARDLGIIEAAHARTLFTEMSARGWRREEPVEFEGHERPQKLEQLTVRALAEGILSPRQAEHICPGVSDGSEDVEMVIRADARSFLELPRAERDRLMERAAALVADDYVGDGGLAGLESLAEEDYLDGAVDG